MTQVPLIHVMAGYHCNFECTHCVNDSGPKRRESMSDSEIANVRSDIFKKAPKQLLFTGGEPTLLTNIINQLIDAHPNKSDLSVMVTTNGWFAKTDSLVDQTLSKFIKLDHVQLSYDLFHGSKVALVDIKRLKSYCERNNISFSISVCISQASDLIYANQLQTDIGCQITYQKVEASGRGKTNNTNYRPNLISKCYPKESIDNNLVPVGFAGYTQGLKAPFDEFGKPPNRTLRNFSAALFDGIGSEDCFAKWLDRNIRVTGKKSIKVMRTSVATDIWTAGGLDGMALYLESEMNLDILQFFTEDALFLLGPRNDLRLNQMLNTLDSASDPQKYSEISKKIQVYLFANLFVIPLFVPEDKILLSTNLSLRNPGVIPPTYLTVSAYTIERR
jgi:organic radical activating enzyme